MKQILRLTLALLMVSGVTSIHAQAPQKVATQKHAPVKQDLRTASLNQLKNNHPILMHAKKSVSEGKNYTGNFALAVRHQKFAKALHGQAKFQASLYHGRLARKYALQAIKENKGKTHPDWEKEDKALYENQPEEGALKKELPEEKLDDKEALELELSEFTYPSKNK